MTNHVNLLKEQFTYAVHGGGVYSGCEHTNTKEAVDYWIRKGIRVLEIDLGIGPANLEPIAFAHFLEREYDWLQKELNPSCINHDYNNNKLYPLSTKGLTILTLSDLCDYLVNYQDLIIMFDFYGGNVAACSVLTQAIATKVAGKPELLDRILIEVYTEETIRVVLEKIPNAHVIFGESVLSRELTVEQIMSYGINFVSFPRKDAILNFEKFKKYRDNGFTIFSLSVSNVGSKKWADRGVNVNIVDIKFDNVFHLIKHYCLHFKHLACVFYLYVQYYGIKKVIAKFINRFIR